MSVLGLKRFREAMRGFEGSYALIGGSACDLLLAEQGVVFRATKDLDIVVLTDSPVSGFVAAFWKFIKDGGYEPWCSRDEKTHFYRFVNPKEPDYPHMIELFARDSVSRLFDDNAEVARLPFDGNISSLSAILLDNEYYRLLLKGLIEVDGISTLDEAHLILLKMRAHIDLNERHAEGLHVNAVDLKKHRKDVVRLLEYVPDDLVLDLSERVKGDCRRFIDTLEDADFRVDQLHVSISKAEAILRLKHLCGI